MTQKRWALERKSPTREPEWGLTTIAAAAAITR